MCKFGLGCADCSLCINELGKGTISIEEIMAFFPYQEEKHGNHSDTEKRVSYVRHLGKLSYFFANGYQIWERNLGLDKGSDC